jgi:hypothetical protein
MAQKRKINKAMKKAGAQYKKHRKTAKSGYNASSMSSSKTKRGGTKGYSTRVGATKNVKYKGKK